MSAPPDCLLLPQARPPLGAELLDTTPTAGASASSVAGAAASASPAAGASALPGGYRMRNLEDMPDPRLLLVSTMMKSEGVMHSQTGQSYTLV